MKNLTAFLFLYFCVIPAFSLAAGFQRLPGHVPSQAAAAPFLGAVPGETLIRLAIGLPLRRQAELQSLLTGLYDPRTTQYRQYLAPGRFAAEFGPSREDVQVLVRWCASQGLDAEPQAVGALLKVSGRAVAVEQAFHLKLNYHQRSDGSQFFAPDQDPSLELDLPIHHISGLDDFAVPRPHEGTGTGSCTSLGYTGRPYVGNDFRSVYLPGVTLDGTGQTVALVEFDNYYANDITLYSNLTSIPVPSITIRLVDQNKAPHPGTGNGEVALDIEMVMAMAPKAAILVYEQPNRFTYPAVDILNAIANDDQAQAISCSWTWTGGVDPNLGPVFLQYAAQGQSFLQASGDLGAYLPGSPSPQVPNPMLSTSWLTAVGGTELSTTGPGAGSYVTETTWNNPLERTGCSNCNSVSSGGVVSGLLIPTWQAGMDMSANGGSATLRNLPDISMIGDNLEIYADNGSLYCSGGTSASAPLWAGLVCLVNQQAQANGKGNAGFLNPALYALAQNPTSYAADFHDVNDNSSNNYSGSGDYLAVTGYDLATGWGSPKANLINDLAGLAPTASMTPTATSTRTPTRTATPTFTATRTNTPTVTFTRTLTFTPSNTGTATNTATRTNTATITPTGTSTFTPSNTGTATNTATRTNTRTATSTGTPTFTPTNTSTAANTATFTMTRTFTNTATRTNTPDSTGTAVATATPTRTFTSSFTAVATPTFTTTRTFTRTHTPVATSTLVSSPTSTNTAVLTLPATSTYTSTFTPLVTLTLLPATATFTPVPPTATPVLSPTATSIPSAIANGKIIVTIPDHAGGDVTLVLSKPGASVDHVSCDVYAVDHHRISHWETNGGQSAVWHTGNVAPGLYYLKFNVYWSDGAVDADLVRKVVLRQ